MSIESIRKEYTLETELDMKLPGGSFVIIETTTATGCEVSALRTAGGKMHSPITVQIRMDNRTTAVPTTITFVDGETGDGRRVTLPENRGVISLKLKPLMAETNDSVSLKPLSNSELAMLFKKG